MVLIEPCGTPAIMFSQMLKLLFTRALYCQFVLKAS